MRTAAAILRNNFYRMLMHKSRIYLCFGLITGAFLAALFLRIPDKPIGKVAVVSEYPIEMPSPYLNVVYLETEPSLSELFLGKYDAVLTYSEESGYGIKTIKNGQFKKVLEEIVRNPFVYSPDSSNIRQIGTSIMGFLTMFILIQGLSAMYLFAEDQEHEQIKRIASSPASFTGYLLGHSIFTFLFMLLPTLFIISFVKYICRVPIGFSLLEYLFLLSVICGLAASFALFLNAIIKNGDSANMIGSAAVILTSILAGSFYSFEENNKVLSAIVNILPQKMFLTLADLLEKGSGMQAAFPYAVVLIVISLLLFFTAVLKTSRAYAAGNKMQQKEGHSV